MKKPKKRAIGIKFVGSATNYIQFQSNKEIAALAADFGKVEDKESYYALSVDYRYDFNEVLNYLKSFND